MLALLPFAANCRRLIETLAGARSEKLLVALATVAAAQSAVGQFRVLFIVFGAMVRLAIRSVIGLVVPARTVVDLLLFRRRARFQIGITLIVAVSAPFNQAQRTDLLGQLLHFVLNVLLLQIQIYQVMQSRRSLDSVSDNLQTVAELTQGPFHLIAQRFQRFNVPHCLTNITSFGDMFLEREFARIKWAKLMQMDGNERMLTIEMK